MVDAIKNDTWIGVPSDITPADVNSTFAKINCNACQLSKSNKLAREEESGIHPQFSDQVCLMNGYRHVVMVKDKSSACFNEVLAHVIDFYNLHGHVVKKTRFDVGSTENALETVQFLETNRIQVDPAAVKSQFQNPVEREVQTLNKGVRRCFAYRSVFSWSEFLGLCCRILGSYCESHHWLLQR